MKQTLKSISLALIMAFASLVLFYLAGARINTTKSIPVGLYWATDEYVRKGSYVMFCPPELPAFLLAKERGYIATGMCPGGYGYMMKRILAAKNDVVRFTDQGVFVNGTLLPLSKPLYSDLSGRPLPHFRTDAYTLTAEDVLLMSEVSATSFDGRYCGPVNVAQIRSVIKPIFIW